MATQKETSTSNARTSTPRLYLREKKSSVRSANTSIIAEANPETTTNGHATDSTDVVKEPPAEEEDGEQAGEGKRAGLGSGSESISGRY